MPRPLLCLLAILTIAGGSAGIHAGDDAPEAASFAVAASVRLTIRLERPLPRPPPRPPPSLTASLEIAQVTQLRLEPVGAPSGRPSRHIDVPRVTRGVVDVGGLALGAYDVAVLPWEVTVRLTVEAGTTALDVAVPAPRIAHFEVVGEDGAILPEAQLADASVERLAEAAAGEGDEGSVSRNRFLRDDVRRRGLEHGRGGVLAFPGERHRVTVVAPGYTFGWTEVEVPAIGAEVGAAVKVALRRGATVRGLMRAGLRAPLKPATHITWSRARDGWPSATVPCNAAGETMVLPLGPGYVRVGDWRPDGCPEFRAVELVSGGVIDL